MASVVFALVIVFALAVLLARYATNPSLARAEARERARPDRRPRIRPSELRALVLDLLDALGLEVREEEVHGGDRRFVARERTAALGGGRYLVFVMAEPPGDVVEQAQVIELAEAVKAERGATGLLITPYAIDVDGLGGLDVPLELIDGPRLRELVAEHLPDRARALDGYRGFSPATIAEPADELGPRPRPLEPRPV